jgi:hypothetical protein
MGGGVRCLYHVSKIVVAHTALPARPRSYLKTRKSLAAVARPLGSLGIQVTKVRFAMPCHQHRLTTFVPQ